MAFFPISASAFAACSDSDIWENATRQSARISPRLRILPSVFVVWTVSSPKASPTNVTSPVRLVSMVRMSVPAWEDLMPAFAIRPMASAVNPNAPATGAQCLNVSPIMETFVFTLELAAARISAHL